METENGAEMIVYRIASGMLLLLAGCSASTRSAGFPLSVVPTSIDEIAARRFTTPHFDLHSTLSDAEFESSLPRFLETAHARYVHTLPPRMPEGRLTVFVFENREQWLRFVRTRFPVKSELYANILSGGFTENNVSALFYSDRAATLATLAHEGWHQYAAVRLGGEMPAWLNEGLACYHESAGFSEPDRRFNPRHNSFRTNDLRLGLHRDRLFSVDELLQIDAGQVVAQDDRFTTRLYYAQVWALVTFLKHDADSRVRQGFANLLDDVADGSYPVRVSAAQFGRDEGAAATAFHLYFDAALQTLEQGYRQFLLRLVQF